MNESRLYLSIRRTNPRVDLEKGCDYFSRVDGNEGLSYDAECALGYLGREIGNSPVEQRIVFRNHLPESDPLKEPLDMLVSSHNILRALRSGEAKKVRKVLAGKRV